MAVEVSRRGSIVVLRPSKSLDRNTASGFLEVAAKIVEDGEVKLVIDCAEMANISVEGANALVVVNKLCLSRRGEMVLAEMNDRCTEYLQELGVSRFVVFALSVEEGIDFFQD